MCLSGTPDNICEFNNREKVTRLLVTHKFYDIFFALKLSSKKKLEPSFLQKKNAMKVIKKTVFHTVEDKRSVVQKIKDCKRSGGYRVTSGVNETMQWDAFREVRDLHCNLWLL